MGGMHVCHSAWPCPPIQQKPRREESEGWVARIESVPGTWAAALHRQLPGSGSTSRSHIDPRASGVIMVQVVQRQLRLVYPVQVPRGIHLPGPEVVRRKGWWRCRAGGG